MGVIDMRITGTVKRTAPVDPPRHLRGGVRDDERWLPSSDRNRTIGHVGHALEPHDPAFLYCDESRVVPGAGHVAVIAH